MSEQLDKVRKEEHRTRSEIMREALRQYIENRYSTYTPTKAEFAAIRRGRAEIKRGDFVTLKQLHNELGSANRKPGKKSPRKISR